MKLFRCWLVVLTGCSTSSSFVMPSSTIRRTDIRHGDVLCPPSIGTAPPLQNKPRPRRASSLNMSKLPTCFLANRAPLHANPSFVLSAMLLLSTFGITLEKRTTVGKALSAPLATMALALTVANLGLVPFISPVCKYESTPMQNDRMIDTLLTLPLF